MKRIWIMLLAAALMLTGVRLSPETQVMAAKKKMKLSKKKLTLQVGKKKQLKVKNKKGKVKWRSSKKKVAAVSKKGLVKAMKTGKATITATVTYKKKKTKLKCKVTVIKKKIKTTKKPTLPTPGKTVGSTAAATSKPPAATPAAPPINPDGTIPWEEDKQGSFYLSSIGFSSGSLTYQTGQNTVFLDLGSKNSVLEAVPDLSKCTFEVYAGGKSYKNAAVGDIKWSSKSYYTGNIDQGYYEFKVYITDGRTTYYKSFIMAERLSPIPDDGRNFEITSIQSGQNKLTPSKDSLDPAHYMLDVTSASPSVRALLPDLGKATFAATYMGRNVVVEKVKDIRWVSQSFYDNYPEGTGYYSFTLVAKNGAQLLEIPMILSDYNETLAVTKYTYEQEGEPREGTVMDYHDEITIAGQKGKSLKELYPNPETLFTFTCLYRGKLYPNVKAGNVKWVGTPFWENGCDLGYYTFSLTITGENGKTIKRDFTLAEEYRDLTYKISGVLKDGSGKPAGGQNLIFSLEGDGDSYEVVTEADGSYDSELPEGDYKIFWNYTEADTVTVEKKALTHNINAFRMFQYSGLLTRFGKPWTDVEISFYGNEVLTVRTDAKTGAYSIYLPSNNYFSVYIDNFYMQEFITYEAIEDRNNDISCDYVKVSGTVYQNGEAPLPNNELHIKWGETSRYIQTDENGKYLFYAAPNTNLTIRHTNSNTDIAQFSVAKDDVIKDMTVAVTHITGLVKAKNGDALIEHYLWFINEENGNEIFLITDENGRYSTYLKPGTYSITSLGNIVLDQKITVGATGAVHNFEAPLYKVSGTVKVDNRPWCNQSFRLCWSDTDPYGDYWMETDSQGNYCTYVPAKDYVVISEDHTKNSGVPLQVKGDMTKDLQFRMHTVKGHIYRTGTTEFESDVSISLDVLDPDGETVEYLHPTMGNEYELYLEKEGTYEVQCSLGWSVRTVDTFEVTGSELTHDIVCNIYRISGSVTGLNDAQNPVLEFEFENEETTTAFSDDVQNGEMAYYIYLPAGTYNAYLWSERDHKTQVRVTGDNDSLNFAAKASYKVSGTVKRPDSETPLGGKKISFHPQGTGQYCEATSAADGTYEVFLYPDTYDIHLGNEKISTIVVTDQDLSKDIETDRIEVSGSLMRNGKPVMWAPLDFRPQNATPGSALSATTDHNGKYLIYLPMSAAYDIYYNNTLLETVTVTDHDISDKNLTLNMTEVSGNIKTPEGEAVRNLNFTFYKEGSESTNVNAFTDNEGNYVVYLTPGTYDIKYNNSVVLRKDLVVGGTDLTENLTPALYEVSGTASKEKDGVWVYDSEKNCCMSFWIFSGTYSVYLPKGEYVFVLDNAETVDKSLDEIADEYKVKVTVENKNTKQDLEF